MRYYKNRYNQFQYQPGYSNESDMELNPEFSLESENDKEYNPNYEMEGSYNMENEGNYEYQSNYEIEPEFNMEEEGDYESQYNMESEFENEENEFQQEGEGPQDEMEAELEFVTNEQEFNRWVNKVVTRDRRQLRPILRTPLGQRAVKQFAKIAFRTLPYIGRRRPGWNRPYQYRRPYYSRWGRPGYRRWYNRQPWGISPQTFPDTGIPQQPQTSPGPDMPQQPQASPGMDGQQQPQIQQDGSFKNFVLDTIKNLSEQIAKGNESIMALKNSMTNSAVNNFPAIVQPKTDAPDQPPPPTNQPAPGTPTPPANTTQQPAPTGEFEWEDYEYDNEYSTEYNNEYNNESNYEYNNETDGEITDRESSFNEVTEIQLASELLSVNNEMELDHFLGKLLKAAVGGFSRLLASPGGALLKKGFSKILSTALPIVGGVVGGPVGAVVGNTIGTTVANEFFNLELEGLSDEDSEFEIAKAFVRFAGNAAKEAHDNETGNPAKDAELAMIRAARRFAPGLLRSRRYRHYNQISRYDQNSDNTNENDMGDNGRWYRRGNKIIIQGAF